MKTVILQSLDGAHLGFLLCAIPPADLEGDCVFVIVPDQAEMLEDAEVRHLLKRKEVGESEIELSADRHSAVIRTHGLEEMFVELGPDGTGQWGYIREPKRAVIGLAATIDQVIR